MIINWPACFLAYHILGRKLPPSIYSAQAVISPPLTCAFSSGSSYIQIIITYKLHGSTVLLFLLLVLNAGTANSFKNSFVLFVLKSSAYTQIMERSCANVSTSTYL